MISTSLPEGVKSDSKPHSAMAEVLGQRSLLGFGVVLVWLLLFHLLVNIWLLCVFTSLLVVLGGWLGSQAVLESNRPISHLYHLIYTYFVITQFKVPPSVEDEHHLDQEIYNTVKKIIRDFVTSWYSTVSSESGFESEVQDAMISMAMELKIRARQLNRKLTQRILNLFGCHLQDYIRAKELVTKQQTPLTAKWSSESEQLWKAYSRVTTPHLAMTSDTVEVSYTRAVVDLLLHVLVPSPHLESRTGRFVVGELITCNVMLPLIAKLSDPDWLNILLIEIFAKSSKPKEPITAEPLASSPPLTPPPPPPPPAESELASLQETTQAPRKNNEVPPLRAEPTRSFLRHFMRESKTNPFYQESDSDLDSPLADYKQSSIDSLVMIGQGEGLYDKRKECATSVDSSNNGVDLGDTGLGNPNELIVGSPLQGSSPIPSFSFEPLSSPDGPVIIQNLRISGTITAKEHRGTGSHPYTLYTIKDAEVVPSGCENPSPIQPVAYHMVNRRYSEFLNLQTRLEEKTELRKLIKGVKGPKKIFPDMPFGNMDSDRIEARKGLLETFLKQLCSIPEIANSEEMQEFLALNTDARIAFVKKPFIVSRIDKIVVNAIVDTLKTAFPRSEPPSPTDDNEMGLLDLHVHQMHTEEIHFSETDFGVDLVSDIHTCPSICLSGATFCMLKQHTVQYILNKVSDLAYNTLSNFLFASCVFWGTASEMALAEVALNILCLLMKEQWSWLCTENIQRTVRLLFGTLINRWLDVSVANLTCPAYWVVYLQVIQESVWPGGALPTVPQLERSQQQKDSTRQQALHCLMRLLPDLISDMLGSEKYKLSWQTALDSLQDPNINRHLVYCIFDLLLEFLVPEIPEEDFQRSLLRTLSKNPEKLLA
uniref:Sorting nexin 19 n=1 Tax=Sander lucioperca TaxID=283035 RepID=A0A8C9Y3I8_SANLU